MVEFVIVVPMLMFMGLGIMQFGLIYHAKSILNYATFEAARAGAVNNAQIEVMRKELGYRMAPVYGGDGSLKKGAMSLTRSMVAVNDTTTTKIELINPVPGSFDAHGIEKEVVDRHGVSIQTKAIPNSHLRFAPTNIGGDNLSLQDANLLKIQVTYGYQIRLPFLDMKVPGVSWITRNLMLHGDPDNWMYYVRGMIPLKATATVRMQSESWEFQEKPLATKAFDSVSQWIEGKINDRYNTDTDGDGIPDTFVDGGDDYDDDDTDPDGEDSTDNLIDDNADLECESSEDPNNDEASQELEEDKGFFGSVWDSIKSGVGEAYDFVRGFWIGLKKQLGDIADLVLHPIETAKGLYALGKALITDTEATLTAIGEAIGKDLSTLVNCGSYDRGRIIGEYVNPAFMLKLAAKLAKYDGDLNKAIDETKTDLIDCASFVAGTQIWTPDGFVSIESIGVGQLVHSRNTNTYQDKPQAVTDSFGRIATHYYQLTTEQDQISLTAEHPLWVQGSGWVKAEHVKHGDVLATADGDTLVLGNFKIDESVEVYNFSVANTPNYFVGSERLWVHNAGSPCRLKWIQNLKHFPDVKLVGIEKSELFSGVSTRRQGSLRGVLENKYEKLKEYTGDNAWQAHHVIPYNLRNNESWIQ